MSASDRAVIIAGGEGVPGDWLRHQVKGAAWILAADRGADHALEAGIHPTSVVGDFDSMSAATLERLRTLQVPLHAYPSEKDESDLELALRHALRVPVGCIDIYCALGGRVDHLLTNVAVPLLAHRQGVACWLRSPATDAFYVLSEATIVGTPGDVVTLMAMSDTVDGITTKGLRYALDRGTLSRGSSRGLSNVMSDATAHVRVDGGDLLVVVTRQA